MSSTDIAVIIQQLIINNANDTLDFKAFCIADSFDADSFFVIDNNGKKFKITVSEEV